MKDNLQLYLLFSTSKTVETLVNYNRKRFIELTLASRRCNIRSRRHLPRCLRVRLQENRELKHKRF